MDFSPSYFFDLSSFKYRALFDGCTYFWEGFSKISTFLRNQELGKIEVEIPNGAHLVNASWITIGKGTVIEPGCYIKGPCIIGENCSVRHGAYIRGDVITGNGCVIGHDTEIKNSILLDGAHAAHFAYLGDSILGNKVNLGAGTKCANLRLDNSQIVIHFNGEKISTGLRKFGAIIGDSSQIGCNAVTNPGSLIGQNVRAYPCTNFGGFIPSNCLVKPDIKIICKEDV